MPETPYAFCEQVTGAERSPLSMASSAVITFVVEAIGRRSRLLASKSTRPVLISITQAAFAEVSPSASAPYRSPH